MMNRRHGGSVGTVCCRMVAAAVLWLLLVFPLPQALAELTGTVNINTAGVEELAKLPYIGQDRAKAIIKYRETHGPFATIEELTKSEMVGPATLEAIRHYLAVSGPTTLAVAKNPGGGVSIHRAIVTRPGEIHVLADREYYPTLAEFIRNARKSVDIAMFLFKTTRSADNLPAKIARELINARRRGVEVLVVLEKSGYDQGINKENQRVARWLKKNRITVRFDTPERTNHAKLVVIDQRFSFVGSHNFTHAALAFNHELSLMIDNPTLAGRLTTYIRGLGIH